MRRKSMKMMFMASIIRHKLYMIYVVLYFLCSKIIFDQKSFSYCCDKFEHQGSIVYLSCFAWLFPNLHFFSTLLVCPIYFILYCIFYFYIFHCRQPLVFPSSFLWVLIFQSLSFCEDHLSAMFFGYAFWLLSVSSFAR